MRLLHLLIASLLTVVLLWINIAVHTAPHVGSQQELAELRHQLAYLEPRVHQGLGTEMQKLFPEGGVFTHALYGLAWCGVADRLPPLDTVRRHAYREARWAYAQVDTQREWTRFPELASPQYGVFYAGWRNYLLARMVAVGAAANDTILLQAFDRQSDLIAKAFARSSSPYLESYTGMAWPADATVAMASLCMHERLRGARHATVIARWATQVRARRDERGMIPHAWDPRSDRIGEQARGCSQSLMNTMLPAIDKALAWEQYQLYRDHFLTEPLGLPAMREYPHGASGGGDVDSGPVIFGVGSAATLVSAGACRANDAALHAHVMDATNEALGFVTGGQRKRYLFGAMPIADLFIAWGRSIPCAHASHPAPAFKTFHGWSLLILLVLWSPVIVRWWRRSYRSR